MKLNGINMPEFTGAIVSSVCEITRILIKAIKQITGLDAVCVSVENSAGLIIDIDSLPSLGTFDSYRRCREKNIPPLCGYRPRHC